MTKTENPSREAYLGTSTVTQSRTATHFPCGKHEIIPENSYAPTHEGGLPRDKWCEREKRKERYRMQKAQREEDAGKGIPLVTTSSLEGGLECS